MKVPLYHVDAFTSRTFGGNPAAVVPLEAWPDAAWLQKVAMEMNLSETAYIVRSPGGYDLRWFTPKVFDGSLPSKKANQSWAYAAPEIGASMV